jgi:hypothetical protein
VFSSFSNCSLTFAVYLWKLTEENLSQTSCKVPGTVGYLELVSLFAHSQYGVSGALQFRVNVAHFIDFRAALFRLLIIIRSL